MASDGASVQIAAAEFIPRAQLGTTDDCGFAPVSDDVSTSRDTAFEKIRSRVLGTALADAALQRRLYVLTPPGAAA